MQIIVTVKEVAIVGDTFEIDGLDVDEKYLSYDLNEWDEYALEAAVQYGENHDDVEVVTVTIGPERAEETIRTALAKGADRAVRVWDDDLAAVDPDPSTTASLLAAVVEDEEPDMVLTGVQSGDASFAATGVALAQHVDFQWAAVVTNLDADHEDDRARVHRELEGGVEEITDVTEPAVFTIQTGINEPRYASLRGIRQAQQKEIAVRTLDDLGLDASVLESPTTRTAMYEPESESDVTIFEGEPEETAAQLADQLRDLGVGDA
ncbi:MAG: electron transfer flavoprotein subunit beta/FixA family protein [Haloarculaceae archaeon]